MGVFRSALVVLIALCGTLYAAAQDPQRPVQTPVPEQQRPVFRTGVDMVRVDVYPRRRNRIVEGLTKDDFQLTEDGVSQTIETFEYISIDRDWGVDPLDPRSESEARRMAADPRNRVFVFYLDTYEITMEGSYRAREPLLAFLQGSMGPRDLFAVMTPKDSPEYLQFTRMTQSLAGLMSVAKPWGQKDTPVEDPKEMELQGCAPGPPDKPGAPNGLVKMMRDLEMLTDLKELIIRLGALREERKNLVIVGERWQGVLGLPPRPPSPMAGAVRAAGVRADQRGRGSFVPPPSVADAWRKCDQIKMYLNRQDFRGMLRDLPETARRHNVALYFVRLTSWPTVDLAGHFADETDGRVIGSNDIAGSLEQVLEHQTGFYMLGYRSTAGEAGKKTRTVRVRTTKDGVDLDVRRLYEPPPPEFVAARSAPPPPVERTDVEKAIDGLPPLREDAELAMRAVPDDRAVDVTIEIAPRLASTEAWRNGGSVAVALKDESGATIASTEATIPAGDHSLRARVVVSDVSKVTRANARVTNAAGATLGDAVPPAARVDGAGIGPPAFFRAGSLPRLPFKPAAFLSFGRTERLRVEWPLGASIDAPEVRILNAAGFALPADVTVTQVEGTPLVLRAEARLLSMAPGEYVIEASGRVGSKPVRHLIAIRVTR